MKKHPVILFFFKCILAALPLFILTGYTALFPFAYMDTEYPSWAYSKMVSHTKQETSDDQNTVLILGDSRAMADIIPAELTDTEAPDSLHVENLAVGGATSIEMYYTLSNYIKTNGVPDRVILMFAPFHYSYMDNFWQRTMYFNYLSVFETAEVFHNADKVHAGAILTDNYLSDSLSCRLRLPNKYLPALINSRLFGRNLENRAAFRLLSDEHGHGLFGDANGCSDLCYEVNYTGMEETGDAALISLYLNKLLTLCSANNIPVILEQPPMNEASWTNLKESFVNDYTLYMEELQSDYPEIQINSQIPCYDDQYFGDSSHLNQKGAVLYSHALKIKYSEFFSLQ